MEQTLDYRQQLLQEYKDAVMPLLNYLPWMEEHAGKGASSAYQGDNLSEYSMSFPVYDATLLQFIREAANSSLMDVNYKYVYTRNRIHNHGDERRIIAKTGWRDWDTLRGILSYYVLGGRTRSTLWSQAMEEQIFYLVLKQMRSIIEYWDKPLVIEGE